ncbi:13640_t:CDS:2 [Cetraspora pellucida]|uniref:13640_t:CDS:1 n=1 Tax=Cetraspora pellucida TaxID=1433469 RepID=A0A9N9DEC1_9GLOM|nr:13640_t:CDS:2 [Cetraspora pellucida]
MKDNNTNVGSIKPVIYHNKRFHYVEEDTAVNFHFDTDYALFQIYKLKGTKNDFAEAITSLAGPASAVAFLNDFERTYPRHSDHRIELRVNSPIEQSNTDRLKIKIKFSNISHMNLMEAFRTSPVIECLTENGFADWVPLDSSSYECIIKMAQASSHENKLTKTEDWNYSILRTLSDPIDSLLLDVALDFLMDDLEIGTFEKLFPGPIMDVDRGVNGVVMTVLQTKERHSFDEDVGKIFIEVLNSLIHDRRVEKNFDKRIYDSYFSLVVRIFNLIRDLIHLNEIYEDFHSPTVCPLLSGSIKYMKIKYIESLTDLEKALTDIGSFKFFFTDRLQELTMMVREIDRNLDCAYKNLQNDIEKWKKRKNVSNCFYILSILIAIAFPSIYHYYRQTENAPFGFVTVTIYNTVIGCVISLLFALWHGWSRNSYSKAIHSHRKAIPVHGAVANSIESLQRWLNRISVVKKCKVPMNNNELAGRKITLIYLFDELVSAAADMRLSIGLEDEFKRHR